MVVNTTFLYVYCEINYSSSGFVDYTLCYITRTEKKVRLHSLVKSQCLNLKLLKKYTYKIFVGSGKSYTMMGPSDQPGLIPRLCSSLFQRTLQETEEKENFTVEVSYMEIYNEKVRDLLDPKGGQHSLKVREHKVLGPYVDGLSRLAVTSCKDIESLMSEGNKSRTVAATNMNEESSRSHAVFNIILTHTIHDLQSGTSGEKVSKLSLVDLAGSERATKTGAVGERLKEGSNINKSLTTLGLVISALSDHSTRKNKFIPYRDSVLTWLLKDSLGGNSKTAMIATVSPAADSYDETLSTLRYADRAKHIVNHAVVNEDPNARIIRQLREEVEKLREQLTEAESLKAPELKDRLVESEKLFKEMTVTWEEKLHKTEEIAQERQKQLESLGISLQSSGIRVGEDKSFLVNLNADPALSELLVYYLKVNVQNIPGGSADSQDIQLCGMGIQDEHCTIDITGDGQVVLSPNENGRTCVNGSIVNGPVFLHHGDRILWGNNHFFRINLPKQRRHLEFENEEDTINCSSSRGQLHVDGDNTNDRFTDTSFSYESAQMEVMMKALGKNEPVQSILWSLEQHHEEEKQSALERQRIMYEQELEYLRRHITRHDQPKYHSMERLSTSSSSVQQRLQWNEEREELLRVSLRKLKEQIVRANLLVQEASFIAQELEKKTEYYVTLQIPASNLNANKKWDAVLSEPAVHVRRKGKSKQIWALEKLENRLVDMRELYQEWKNFDDENPVMHSYLKRADPFFDEEENHTLIGVANVFLSCLFYDVKFQYAVPIISQKGEMVGRLHVELFRVSENMQERLAGGETPENTDENVTPQKTLVCVIRILQATGLPHFLSKFVFCKYCFWGQLDPTSVAPEVDTLNSSPAVKDLQSMVVFDHSKTFSIASTEDFIDYLTEGALAIEVYGHKQTSLLNQKSLALWDLGIIQAKTRTFRDRWSELTRKVEMWVHILEQDENGDYVAVEVVSTKGVCTGGIFQLKQGLSRRIQVHVRSVQDSGTMPLIIKSILSISVGGIKVHQRKPQKGFDSHQDRDLESLRQQWLIEWTKRQDYLDQHLQKLVNKLDKSENDTERECQLLERRLTLIEERNAVMVPSEGSGIPGAPLITFILLSHVVSLAGNHAAAASLLSQQRPSMPKLMKSLFPVQPEKKKLTTSPLLHQVWPLFYTSTYTFFILYYKLTYTISYYYPGNNCSKTTHSEESIVKNNLNISPESRFLSNMCALSDKIKPSHQSNTLVNFNTEANLKTNISPQKDTSEVTKRKTSYISNCRDIREKQTTNQCLKSLPHQIQGMSQSNLPTTSPFKITKVKTSGLKSFSLILGEDLTQSGHIKTAFVPDWLKKDISVTIGNNKNGKVCYIGPTEFAEGIWVGVELEVLAGKNDGFDAGKQYFKCKPGHGVLVRPDRVNRASCNMQQSEDSTHTSV
uniref:Kinesin family member 13Ba n=1 Tax=Erpetoichthys calabaricus TaxID=27687 RepID=A0A8C4RU11_ERPCA